MNIQWTLYIELSATIVCHLVWCDCELYVRILLTFISCYIMLWQSVKTI